MKNLVKSKKKNRNSWDPLQNHVPVKNSSGKCREKKKSSGILSGMFFWVQKINSMKKHLRAHLGPGFCPTRKNVSILSEGHGFVHYGSIVFTFEVKSQKEFIEWTEKSIDDKISRYLHLQRHLMSKSVNPSDVLSVQVVVGGDHGDTAFQFGASVCASWIVWLASARSRSSDPLSRTIMVLPGFDTPKKLTTLCPNPGKPRHRCAWRNRASRDSGNLSAVPACSGACGTLTRHRSSRRPSPRASPSSPRSAGSAHCTILAGCSSVQGQCLPHTS